MTAETSLILTQKAFDALTKELENLKNVQRPAIVEKVSKARDEGDLKENAGYHAAREDLGKLESEIRDLEEKLKNVTITEPSSSEKIEVLSVVTASISGKESEFLLASRDLAVSTDLTIYSPDSPLGVAIIGHKKGDSLSYSAPNGKQIDVTIIDVRPFEA
ncbi:MAG: transcription elongation factor GreA [Bifidobacteriaceae bacterium]|nr:transcription elongation factor GreA [Bifidobacteriaceae bacterium]